MSASFGSNAKSKKRSAFNVLVKISPYLHVLHWHENPVFKKTRCLAANARSLNNYAGDYMIPIFWGEIPIHSVVTNCTLWLLGKSNFIPSSDVSFLPVICSDLFSIFVSHVILGYNLWRVYSTVRILAKRDKNSPRPTGIL